VLIIIPSKVGFLSRNPVSLYQYLRHFFGCWVERSETQRVHLIFANISVGALAQPARKRIAFRQISYCYSESFNTGMLRPPCFSFISYCFILINIFTKVRCTQPNESVGFRICWVSNLLGFESVGFRICWVSNLLGFEYVGFRICWVSNLLGFESVGFRTSTQPTN
jgi:hypothetical protein